MPPLKNALFEREPMIDGSDARCLEERLVCRTLVGRDYLSVCEQLVANQREECRKLTFCTSPL